MSRIKIILLILIIALLGIVFIQNREPIVLKILCGYGTTFCFYRSPSLPLGIWIALFTLFGAIANVLVQTLNSYGYQNSGRAKSSLDKDLYSNQNNWQPTSSRSTNNLKDASAGDSFPEIGNYEAKQEPQNVERSGSTYSYKYREKSDRPKSYERSPNSAEDVGSNLDSDRDDEDWI